MECGMQIRVTGNPGIIHLEKPEYYTNTSTFALPQLFTNEGKKNIEVILNRESVWAWFVRLRM